MFRSLQTNDEDHWPSISDLMSGLMMVFLLIAIAYMHNVSEGKKKVKKIAVTYQETQVALYTELYNEFKNDLDNWQAVIDKDTLSIKFFEPNILFKTGKSDVTNKFKYILSDFFPRYLDIIMSDKFIDSISEIRIEGHTSSEWESDESLDSAYFNNMMLSQERTRSVLQYCYEIVDEKQKKFVRYLITANGLSSSKLVYNELGKEDKLKSRRVEFRTKTNAERKIVQILDELNND